MVSTMCTLVFYVNTLRVSNGTYAREARQDFHSAKVL